MLCCRSTQYSPLVTASPFPQGYTYLGDEFIVVRQMRSAVDAAVPPVTLVWNKILELSFAHGNRLAAKIHQQFCTVYDCSSAETLLF